MKTTLSALFALALSLVTLPAAAQVHAGVSLEAIVPSGATVLDVRAPDEAGLPVRIRLAHDGALAALIDVWVTPSEAAAQAIYDARVVTSASTTLAHRTLGDTARADTSTGAASFVLARRDNIVFSVRTLDAQVDAATIAAHLDAAITHAATGSARPTIAPQSTAADGTSTLSVVPGIVDLTVRMAGDGVFERTADGYRVRGAFVATWVDTQLRVGSRAYDGE